MNMRKPGWWPILWPKSRRPQEPGEALFQGLRTRLTLWYCGVLCAALVLFGVALYFSTQYYLLNPIESDTQFHAQAHMLQWLKRDPSACPLIISQGRPVPPNQEWILCFDQNGSLPLPESSLDLPSAFLTNTVVRAALQSPTGDASDIVDAGASYGQIYRYALVVQDSSNRIEGVVVAGESVQAQESALSLLLTLLLSIGGIALLGAGLGGLFLANRALLPARLAWANQQRFIADASHELRTPLTLLRADAEVLLRGRERLGKEDAILLEDIVAETSHMTNITANLLTLARLDSNLVHREHEVVNLAQLSQETVRRVQTLAKQRDITVQAAPTSTPYVIGDPALLEQAVLVLLDNAIKYNKKGGQVGVYTTIQGEQALLEVRDSGIGISNEHLPYLGQRFYRVDKARSREAGGTGLGISIAQGIAIAHGGQLTLNSIPQQGTTVTLRLPLARQTPPQSSYSAPGSTPTQAKPTA